MLRDFLRLARPFWTSEERGKAWATAALLLTLTLALVGLNVLLVQLQGQFFDALQKYQFHPFLRSLGFWTIAAFVWCVVSVYQSYVTMALTIQWRRWMTGHFLSYWLDNKTFYYWQISGRASDNPDQRISEDIRDFISTNDMLGGFIPLTIGLVQQVVNLLAFVTLLWKVGNLPLFHDHLVIHGYLVWGALLYAGLGSWLVTKIGNPIIRLSFNQQRYEADFRFDLVRLRENGESVALSQGEVAEKQGLTGRFDGIYQNYRAIMSRTKKITGFQTGYQQTANVIPLFLCAPLYFAHRLSLGGLIKATQSFGYVLTAVSYFVASYSAIASWRAVIQRLTGFTQAVEAARTLSQQPGAEVEVGRSGEIGLHGLTLALPNGRTLFRDLDLTLEEGQSALISGPSGTGKSTLLRALSGLWPYSSGRIERPAEMDAMTLPQKPYLPVGPLAAALTYPAPASTYAEADIAAALARVRLPHLAGCLDDSQNWALQLSPGEQQRVALARAFLHRPRWLFLDEATSALDEPTEAALYEELASALPHTTVVSVGHRSTLQKFHAVTYALSPADAEASQAEPQTAAVTEPVD